MMVIVRSGEKTFVFTLRLHEHDIAHAIYVSISPSEIPS